LIDGVKKFIVVRELDIDLIDSINPFEAAYAVLAKAMDEKSLRQVQAAIAAKKLSISEDEARDLSKRALQFKNERGRLPDITSADAWEKRMAEGVAAFARYRAQAKAQGPGALQWLTWTTTNCWMRLGVEVAPIQGPGGRHAPREERIIAGFEDILRFFTKRTSGRHSTGKDGDIFERHVRGAPGSVEKTPRRTGTAFSLG
jgi:hypothetical protein